jgi:predicted metal-dependent HD superfamily phosphohydrolase
VTVLIDPPAWPAHGTLFSHLVSDASLAELHAFAASIGVSRRAFDLDHYDVAAERYDVAVAAGAVPVGGRELARRLGSSGLRVPGRARRAAKADALLARWDALLPGARDVGVDLVERWHEPHRVYHGPEHLVHALDSLALLEGRAPGVPDDVAAPGRAGGGAASGRTTGVGSGDAPGSAAATQLALWFHDAVHDGEAGRDEERSADLAQARLTGHLDAAAVAEVVRLVLVTTDHSPAADDGPGALVSDADLAILGSAPDRYARYVRQVRAEYAHVPDDAFRVGRAAVLRGLLAAGALFRTPQAAALWEAQARANLLDELTILTPSA